MGEKYMECLKIHSDMDGKIDGCQKFSKVTGRLLCHICGCHRNYHRIVLATEVVYTECHKMHRDGSGGGYKDGCKEFVPGFVTTSNMCAACGCHKSFNRNEIIKEVA